MSTVQTGKAAHDAKVAVAEAIRQAAVTPTATKAVIDAAETTFYRTCVTSAIANGCSPTPFLTALAEKHVGIYG